MTPNDRIKMLNMMTLRLVGLKHYLRNIPIDNPRFDDMLQAVKKFDHRLREEERSFMADMMHLHSSQ